MFLVFSIVPEIIFFKILIKGHLLYVTFTVFTHDAVMFTFGMN